MTSPPSRGLQAAIGLMFVGLLLLAPVLFSLGPVTLGLFMVGAGLVVAGLLASLAFLRYIKRPEP